METVREYEIIIHLTKENGRYGAAAETVSGGLSNPCRRCRQPETMPCTRCCTHWH